jgi:hypothetical protein
MRLEDLLASGRSLVEAARDDVRMTLVPHLIDRVNIPEVARGIARVALQVGNEMIDGGASHSAEIDLLVTQLDRIFAGNAVAILPEVSAAFVAELSDQARESVCRRALDLILPEDPGQWLSTIAGSAKDADDARKLGLARVAACGRPVDGKRYIAADRVECINGVVKRLVASPDWVSLLASTERINTDTVIALANATRKAGEKHFPQWLQEQLATPASPVSLLIDALPATVPALETSCAVRVAIGVVKWCSTKDTCTAGDIATAIDDPRTIFRPSGTGPDRLCWAGDRLRLPVVRAAYVELASRALGFLTPPAKGDERKRAEAVLRWMFDLAKTIEGTSPDRASALDTVQQVFTLVETRDYARAISQALLLANRISLACTGADCTIPASIIKALNLLGSVASYVQVYDETKSLDAKEAKAARKKALESLIDSATDRSSRAGQCIWSIGSPVGMSFGGRWTPGTSKTGYPGPGLSDAYARDSAFAWRLPLVLAYQRLPDVWPVGFHMALTVADLGNFTRGATEGGSDKIRWRDFMQLGVQLGLLLGDSKHSVVVAGELSWSPSLYERDVTIAPASGMTSTAHLSGALFAGVTLAYYVPFFDLN